MNDSAYPKSTRVVWECFEEAEKIASVGYLYGVEVKICTPFFELTHWEPDALIHPNLQSLVRIATRLSVRGYTFFVKVDKENEIRYGFLDPSGKPCKVQLDPVAISEFPPDHEGSGQ